MELARELQGAPLDAKGLMLRGYSQHEAYAILRAHGTTIRNGKRMRVSRDVLAKVERGELPT